VLWSDLKTAELGMTSIEDRVARLEAELVALRPSLHERLARLEHAEAPTSGAAPTQATGDGILLTAVKGTFRWMGAELPKLITAIVLLLIGWGIKDSVDLSIKQRQLDLSYAKEMQGLLLKMGTEKEGERPDKIELESTAVVLASYGAPALPALLSELSRGDLRGAAAVKGFRFLALTQPEPVCEVLPRVLSDRGRRFEWLSQLEVVRLLGESDCRNAVSALTHYREVVAAAQKGKTSEFAAVVKAVTPFEHYPILLKAIDDSLGMLKK